MRRNRFLLWASVLLLSQLGVACGQGASSVIENARQGNTLAEGTVLIINELNLDFSKHKVTFIELGADRCIPCKAMQPIMKEIAKEYVGTIQVVFYDVWKDPTPGRKYRIQLIPTQVFIDQSGKEIYRHVGFYAKEEMLQMLKEKRII